MNVILSIKPKYVEKIINGSKKYEFRKQIFKNRKVRQVYIYASYPVRKIVGVFTVGEIIYDTPENLWEKLKEEAGMSEREFFEYFKNTEIGFAIEIKDLRIFEPPIDPTEAIPNFTPPQSFCYVKRYELKKILDKMGMNA